PGYWFGRDFSLYVVDDARLTQVLPPPCIQVTLGLSFEATAPGAKNQQFTVRAVLSRPDAGSPDAGEP
ncbi:MAG TPA: hypothetical protein VND93_24000, partial [Myxococcales bacterium]|nr:hypothetical protein [Myxococcales bacterium]